jgi:hypothetical protein
MDDMERAHFELVRKGIAKLGKGNNPNPRKLPIRLAHLTTISTKLAEQTMSGERHPNSNAHRLFTQMLVAHGGFLRTAEHTWRDGKSSGLLVKHVDFLSTDGLSILDWRNVRGARLAIPDSKTGKLDAEPQYAFLARREDSRTCPVWRLWHYFLVNQLFSPQRSEEPVFVEHTDAGVRDTRRPVTYRSFVDGVKYLLPLASLDPSRYAGHSFRAGGCTDAFDSGVPLDVVIAQGRWKSDAWKRYRRQTAEMIMHLARVKAKPLLMARGIAV